MSGQYSHDPRKHREIIEQVISYADLLDEYEKNCVMSGDYESEREDSWEYKRLLDYLVSLNIDQFNAVYCAYELGGSGEGYFPPVIVDAETEADYDEEVSCYHSIGEWIDWVVGDFAECREKEKYGIEDPRTPERLAGFVNLSACLKRAMNYLFGYKNP